MTLAPPPPLHALPRGTRLVAGMGYSTVIPDVDFETFSLAGYVWNGEKWEGPPGAPSTKKGLPVVGAANYAAHESAEVLLMAYDLKDGLGRRRWRPGLPQPLDLFEYVRSGGLIEAWNVAFERWMWELVCVPRMGWPAVHPLQWRCAMAKARAHALPGSLGVAGSVLSLPTQKMVEGSQLMRKFSMPRNPTKTDPRGRVHLLHDAADVERWANGYSAQFGGSEKSWVKRLAQEHEDSKRYADYNEIDIATEAEASSLIPDLEGDELLWWQVHETINRRGVHVDVEAVENAIAIIEQAHERYNGELVALTGIDGASKVEQLLGWLHGQGVHLDSLDEEAVEAALKLPLPPACKRVLEIRAAIGSASVKKAYAMRNSVCADGRIRDLYLYHAARTGRSTGEGAQPTNMPKAGPGLLGCGTWDRGRFVEGTGCGKHFGTHRMTCPHCGQLRGPAGAHEWSPEIAEEAIVSLRVRSLDWLEFAYGDALGMIVGSLRGMFDAAPGHDLISTDYNSIEAVGLAMLAGEQWRIDVFRDPKGKIYEKSASMMYGIAYEEILAHKAKTGQHHPLRQKGKIAELAFGYGGWIGAAQAFEMPGTEDEIKADILAWRKASPAVEWLWGGQTKGAADAIRENAGGPACRDRWDRTTFYFGTEGAAVQALLSPGVEFPVMRLNGSHTGLTYVKRGDALYCRLPSGRYLTYHRPRMQPGKRGGYDMSYEGWNTNPKNGPKGWITMRTWGARLVENNNQATCAEFLRYGCINLEAAGYPVVLHVYDEIVAEVPEGWGSVEEFESIVTRVPAWAHDWPVRAPDGYRAKRYRKG